MQERFLYILYSLFCIYKMNKYTMPTEFEWDANKAKSNLHKHGIRFEDAIFFLTILTIYPDRIAM